MFPNHLPLAWDWGCWGSGALGTGLLGVCRVRSGCWLARDRACARRKAQGFKAFALCAMGFLGVCLQCSLRLAPAAAWGARDGLGG